MKFAYLIMAHHRFDVLKMLLHDLDDSRNDIFLHIDKKSKNVDCASLRACVNRANLFFVKRINVYWSDYSQIKCIYNLLNISTSYGYHDYYHFMVGVEFPIKTQNFIHSFFEQNNHKVFIGYDLCDNSYLDRIKYYHFFSRYARNTKGLCKFLYQKGKALVEFQKRLGFSRLKFDASIYKKGYANWSIPHEVALLFVNNFHKVKRKYFFTSCADEIIFHTLLYNSAFRNEIYDYLDEYHSAMRLTTWVDPKNQLHMTDIEELLKSDKLFARKFDTDDAIDIIRKIILFRQ